jgi:hypothetical protein
MLRLNLCGSIQLWPWEVIAVRGKVGISYHGVTNLIPPSEKLTLSVVGKGDVTISIKH